VLKNVPWQSNEQRDGCAGTLFEKAMILCTVEAPEFMTAEWLQAQLAILAACGQRKPLVAVWSALARYLQALEEMQPEIDFHKETALIDDHLLDSLTVLSLISELEDAFDITIPAVEIIPQNFNSAEAMWELIQRLADE
jgi:acyl carrier protein